MSGKILTCVGGAFLVAGTTVYLLQRSGAIKETGLANIVLGFGVVLGVSLTIGGLIELSGYEPWRKGQDDYLRRGL